jgi:CRP/FNR family cyclic AMP-dependent transcriptional regulator
MIEVTELSLASHLFLRGLPDGQLVELAKSASVVSFAPGHRLFADGGNATRFWLVRSGRVALDLDVPGTGRMVVEVLRWTFGAVAVGPVEAFEFDAPSVRAWCAADPALGYELTRRFLGISAHRLHATQLKLLLAASAAGRS